MNKNKWQQNVERAFDGEADASAVSGAQTEAYARDLQRLRLMRQRQIARAEEKREQQRLAATGEKKLVSV